MSPRAVARLLSASTAFAVVLAHGAESLDFARTFDDAGDARAWHLTASYVAAGEEHRLELWRDGETRVKRRTDGVVETDLAREPDAVEWSMTVLDLRRRIRTDVDRTHLLRIGHFTDWFAEAHVLSTPRGDYRLTAMDGGVAGVEPIAPCGWYRLEQASGSSSFCWNADARVPLAIVVDDAVVWRATRLEPGPFASNAFAIDDRGFVRNDVNQEIESD